MAVVTTGASKLTERYQTTVPSGVRKQLRLKKGDQIVYKTDADGRIYIEAANATATDPVLDRFLDLIEADIKANPDRLQAFDGALYERLTALVGDIDVDLNEALSPEDE